MSDELVILGRTRAKDPAQEQLREQKDNWNLEVKKLIAEFIFFKQALNGRGNARANLPVSKITEPFPPQIPAYLHELASSYSKVIEDAAKIIDAQKGYSETRQRLQEERRNNAVNSHVSASQLNTESEITKYASWWGSRGWARLSLLRKISLRERDLRIKMLGSGGKLYKQFKEFESQIVNSRNPENIPNAVATLAANASQFEAVFLRFFDKLKELDLAKEEVENKNSSSKEELKESEQPKSSPKEVSKLEELKNKPEKIKKQPKVIEKSEPLKKETIENSSDVWSNFKKFTISWYK